MKILHTGDWHLGHELYGYDRIKEQREMLDSIKMIAIEKQPDLLVVSGDIFHTSTPGNTSQSLLSEAIISIKEEVPGITIILSAGNHDSASRHEVFKAPWQRLGVYAIGVIDRENVENHIVKIGEKGFAVAIPYVSPRNLPENFRTRIRQKLQEMNVENKPVVLSEHITVAGSDYSGHEDITGLSVGGIDSIHVSEICEGYDYVALGHIHKAQGIKGYENRVRYAGTPLAVSFDENYPHSVTFIDIKERGLEPEIEEVEIRPSIPLITLPSSGAEVYENVLQMVREFPDDIEAYLRLNIASDGFINATAHGEILKALEGKKAKFCLINLQRRLKAKNEVKEITVQEFKMKTPLEIAERYLQDEGIEFSNTLKELFKESL